jgi:hypothetical protein
MRTHQNHRDVEHRQIDALAAAGALALEQGAGERKGGHRAGRVIDRRRAELDRVDLRRSGRRHQPGRRLDHVIIGGLPAARPVPAERRDRAVDEARIDRRHRLPTEPQRIESAGTIILDHDVALRDQPLQDRAAGLVLQIESQRALVRGLGQVLRAHAAAVEGAVAAAAAGLIGLQGMLDLDHLGAEQAELIGGERAGQHMGEIDDADALEGSGHARLFSCKFHSQCRAEKRRGRARIPYRRSSSRHPGEPAGEPETRPISLNRRRLRLKIARGRGPSLRSTSWR